MDTKHWPLWLALALPITACTATKAVTPLPEQQILTGQKLNQADANFVTTAYQIVQLDNQQGQLAASQATNPQVRALAGELIAKANALYPRLEDAIKENGITPPTRLPREMDRSVTALSALHGRAFDRAYLADQIASHQRAVEVFEAEQKRTQDPKMRGLADEALPVVQASLAKLQEISAAMK